MFSTWIKRNGGVRVEHCKGNTLQVKKNIAKKTPNVNHSHAKYRETDALWLFISKEDSECWRFSSNHQTGCLQKKNPNWLSLTRLATMQPLAPYGIHTDNCSWYFLYLPAPTEFGLRSCLVKEERWAPLPSNSQVQWNFHGLADVPHKKCHIGGQIRCTTKNHTINPPPLSQFGGEQYFFWHDPLSGEILNPLIWTKFSFWGFWGLWDIIKPASMGQPGRPSKRLHRPLVERNAQMRCPSLHLRLRRLKTLTPLPSLKAFCTALCHSNGKQLRTTDGRQQGYF